MSLPGFQSTQRAQHYLLCDNRNNGLLTLRAATLRYAVRSALLSASESSAM